MSAKRATTTRKVKASKGQTAAAPVARPTIFISYRHATPTTDIARKLYTALVPPADVWNADVFMDDHDLEPSDLFDQEILAALDRTTHFIVLLNNDYWSSDYCRKELARIVSRFEKDRSVRLLFVKAEDLETRYFTFTKDRASGRIQSDDPLIANIGDVQFLGPFNENAQLVRLQWQNEATLSDQLAQLVRRLGKVIAK